jgi:hypothetical protein
MPKTPSLDRSSGEPAPILNIRSLQLTHKFFFGTKLLERLHADTNCQMSYQNEHTILVKLLIPNDNSWHSYLLPASLCVVELQS